MRHLFLILLAIGFVRPLWAQDTRLYKILFESIPRKGATCAEDAERMEKMFSAQTGITLVSARCTYESAAEQDIQISYSAPKRIDPVSTIEYSVGVPSLSQGTFHSRRQCEQNLPPQLSLFQTQTGLEPIAAYCYQESDEKRDAFVLRIDAFGKPKRGLFVANRELFGDPVVKEIAPLEEAVRNYAEARLETISSVVVRPFVLDHSVRTVYYAGNPKSIRVDTVGEYATAESCLAAQTKAAEGVASLNPAPPVFCVNQKLLNKFDLDIYQIRFGSFLQSERHPRTFNSLGECDNYAEKGMQEVESSTGYHAVTAVCDRGPKTFGMTVLVLVNEGP